MHSMAIDRRRFLQLGAGALAGLSLPQALCAAPAGAIYIASAAERGGGFSAVVIDEAGQMLFKLPIETRGHDAAADPLRRRAVLFARRPGQFALVVDASSPDQPALFAPPPDRSFNGHGAFSPDGHLLYATENDSDGNGYLGIYDASSDFTRKGEIATHGIGPHEVVLSPDGTRLIVANGGIATDPEIDGGRHNLNIRTMQPSLVELKRETGVLINRIELEPGLRQLSIRHLAFDADGSVWFGCQWEGDPVDHPPLVGRLRRNGSLDLTQLEKRPLLAARNYIGALAANRDGSIIAASCPRGGVILAFDAASGRLIAAETSDDASAIAPVGEAGILVAGGNGQVQRIEPGRTARTTALADVRFDNHLRLFTPA
jgi:hypothetical protein